VHNSYFLHVTHRGGNIAEWEREEEKLEEKKTKEKTLRKQVPGQLHGKKRSDLLIRVMNQCVQVDLIKLGGDVEAWLNGVSNKFHDIRMESARPHDRHLLQESFFVLFCSELGVF